MHRLALFVFGVLALGSAARLDIPTGGRAQSAGGGAATRQAFLKLIERPRVPLEPVTKPGSEFGETVVEEVPLRADLVRNVLLRIDAQIVRAHREALG